MCDLVSQKVLTARKKHVCNGNEVIETTTGWDQLDEDYGEPVERCPGINKGNRYLRQAISDNGTLSTFKTCMHCLEIMEDNEMFGD